jgi:hypothetical protein
LSYPNINGNKKGEGTRGERKGMGGKGLGFWNNTTWESVQILRFSIPLRYQSPNIICFILGVDLNHWVRCLLFPRMMTSLKMKVFGDWWHVSKFVCVFIGFALLEDMYRSWLVKFGFEIMRPRATKSHIFYICNLNITI